MLKTPQLINLSQWRRISYKRVVSWYSGLVKPKPQEPPYNHIIQIGDPTLRHISEPVPQDLITSPEIKFLITRMRKVFNKFNCIGLAAPQIGTPIRIIMYEFDVRKHGAFYSTHELSNRKIVQVPFTVIINPIIKITDYQKTIFTESCQSVKGFYADVARFKALELEGFDEDGKAVNTHAKGWLARIIQHEMDHLNGKIYTDLMDRKTLTCSCWQVINERGGKVELPYGDL